MEEEQINALIAVIGEDSIEKAFQLMGNEKISFARLRLWVRKQSVIKAVKEGDSFSRISRKYGISRMTVYRIFNNECRPGKGRS